MRFQSSEKEWNRVFTHFYINISEESVIKTQFIHQYPVQKEGWGVFCKKTLYFNKKHIPEVS